MGRIRESGVRRYGAHSPGARGGKLPGGLLVVRDDQQVPRLRDAREPHDACGVPGLASLSLVFLSYPIRARTFPLDSPATKESPTRMVPSG